MDEPRRKRGRTNFFLSKRPLVQGNMELECGDEGFVKKVDDGLFLALIDALGHGGDAHSIAIVCKNFLEKNCTGDLAATLNNLHEYIRSLNKGAVVCICRLDIATGELRYVGAGNISLRRFGSTNTRVVYGRGIVGYQMPTPREEMLRLRDEDVLILHTDGVKEHFDIADYPELLKDNVQKIAETIIRQFGKRDDDAACIALRYNR